MAERASPEPKMSLRDMIASRKAAKQNQLEDVEVEANET